MQEQKANETNFKKNTLSLTSLFFHFVPHAAAAAFPAAVAAALKRAISDGEAGTAGGAPVAG